jgi:hypothetical protein
VTVTATDGTYSGTLTFNWVVNNPISITGPGVQTTILGITVSLQLLAQDATSPGLTFSAVGLPTGLSMSGSGLISGNVMGLLGDYDVTVTATSGNYTETVQFEWIVIL